ncbi:MAG: glycosyltransferase family 4 protein [Bacteriovoracaceae bacterium]|jgi:glycosyltransferase involved in cell wall biosynthesis|nr:glycosyltransferase family 4 protein [Bacteriovoracaceae bacterium]
MKVLQIVKTTDGADWAFKQVGILVSKGIEVHIILPNDTGRFIENWKNSGATIHILNLDLPKSKLYKISSKAKELAILIDEIKPDFIHSHFFITTIIARKSFKYHNHPCKIIYQVAGPLHLEKWPFKMWDLLSAKKERDFWIASSIYIKNIYLNNGINKDRLFLSYYGSTPEEFKDEKTNVLRSKLNMKDDFLIGNISHMYPPKYYLGQFIGLKCHELMIKAFALAKKKVSTKFVFIGGQWGEANSYELKLKELAKSTSKDIYMYGHMDSKMVKSVWADFDLAVHFPVNENCGGVIEPLMANVPIIASDAGGLPEVVIHNKTGLIAKQKDIEDLKEKIEYALDNPQKMKQMTVTGQKLVRTMFDVKRTAVEIFDIYHFLKDGGQRPSDFCSKKFIENE